MSKAETSKEALTQLSNEYGTSVEQLHHAMLKQAEIYPMITAVQFTFHIIFHLLLTITGLLIYKHYRKRVNEHPHGDNFSAGILSLVSAVIIILYGGGILIGGVQAIESSITAKRNPDYWVYQQVQDELIDINESLSSDKDE